MERHETPPSARHMGLPKRRDRGKSWTISARTERKRAIVSGVTCTVEPVAKAMELHGAGPAVSMDGTGFRDSGAPGRPRVNNPFEAAEKTGAAMMGFGDWTRGEGPRPHLLKPHRVSVIAALNPTDVVTGNRRAKASTFIGAIFAPSVGALIGRGPAKLRKTVALPREP